MNAPSGTGSKIARAVLATSASQFAVIAFGFGTSIAQARLLGAAGRGDVTRFSNASALAVLYLGFGISSAITYFVASGAVEPRALVRVLRRAFMATVLGLGVCVAGVAHSPLRRFLPDGLSVSELVLALCAFFALSQLSAWLSAFQAARRDFAPLNTASVVVSALAALASGALLFTRPSWAGPSAIIALLVALEAVRVAILLLFTALRRAESDTAPGAAPVSQRAPLHFKQLVLYSGLIYVGDMIQFMTYRFDMWVVDAWGGVANLGRYSLAVTLAQMVWIVPLAAGRVLFPYAAQMGRGEGAVLAFRAARICLLLSVAAALLGYGCARLFLTTLFGADFAEVPALLGVLLLGVVPYSVSKVLGNYLAGINAVGTNVLANLAGLVITVVLDLILIPKYGAVGAAWATAISYCAYTVLLFCVFVYRSSLPLWAIVRPSPVLAGSPEEEGP